MTDAEIDAMEAGPECDRLVAEVLGSHPDIDTNPPGLTRRQGNGYWSEFRPSTDWNDAMFEAERFGMWNTTPSGGFRHLHKITWRDADYHIGEQNYDDCETIASAPSGPLSICRAILKLARKE